MGQPWWGRAPRPPQLAGEAWPQTNDAQGRSGLVALTSASGDSGVAGVPITLCSANSNVATPYVLEVRVNVTAGAEEGASRQTWDFPSGGDVAGFNNGRASLVLEYGAGSTRQRVVCDLRSGSYQIPPSEQVRVSVVTVANAAGTFAPAVQVQGSLAEGSCATASDPTYTIIDDVEVTSNFIVPDNARTVDLWLADTAKAYGAGAPVLYLYCRSGEANGMPQLIRDYTTGIWAPPYPGRVAMAGNASTETAQVTIETTVANQLALQFRLEL